MNDKTKNSSRTEFITPSYALRTKVGTGGLPPETIQMAQKAIENSEIDFPTLAKSYLREIKMLLEQADTKPGVLEALKVPTAELKSGGGMLSYPVVSALAQKQLLFLESIEDLDQKAIEITNVFYKAISVIIAERLRNPDQATQRIAPLQTALDKAYAYYNKKKN